MIMISNLNLKFFFNILFMDIKVTYRLNMLVKTGLDKFHCHLTPSDTLSNLLIWCVHRMFFHDPIDFELTKFDYIGCIRQCVGIPAFMLF